MKSLYIIRGDVNRMFQKQVQQMETRIQEQKTAVSRISMSAADMEANSR